MDLALAAELDRVNEEFSAALDALDAALRGSQPDLAELGKRRTRLARLAGQRLRFLNNRLCPALAAGPTPAHPAAARALENRVAALFSESTNHIGQWNNATIAADWTGYITATRNMLRQVRSVLAMERRDIYPLLGSLPRAA
jgi:hypothetical protein